ncbi:glycosyltransferase [Candidatus Bathyarchaeota archaeon]|nr:glycosyltransferase [Candidatus Bathyarchaeota archaeon]
MTTKHACLVASGDVIRGTGGITSFTSSYIDWLLHQHVKVTLLHRRLPKVIEVVEAEPSENVAFQEGNSEVSYSAPFLLYQASLLFFSLAACLGIMGVNKKNRLSVIHAQDTIYAGLSAGIVGKLCRIPVVVHSHGDRIEQIRNLFPKMGEKSITKAIVVSVEELIQKIVLKYFANRVIAVGEFTGQSLIEYGLSRSKLVTLGGGIDVRKFEPKSFSKTEARNVLGIDSKSFVVGYAGRLSPEKNISSLATAVAELVHTKNCPNICLLIIGGGSEEEELKALVEKLGIVQVTILTGYRRDISRILHAIDVFVLPSFTEGLPMALLEAMSARIAIIASDIPNIRKIIKNDETGLLIDPRNTNTIKEAILNFYTNPSLRDLFAARAASSVQEFDQTVVFQKISEVYTSIA